MSQTDLFSNDPADEQRISLQGFGELRFFPSWLDSAFAQDCYLRLQRELTWEQPEIFVYGQRRLIPRKQAWYGDSRARMAYSGTEFEPTPWHPLLLAIKQKLQVAFALDFNSVLVNLYRDGNDSVSWHADDEPELGPRPVIASISLGAERKFSLKPKSSKLPNAHLPPVHLPLRHGDLVIMGGGTQTYWHHAIMKQKKITQSRINLTYRRVTLG